MHLEVSSLGQNAERVTLYAKTDIAIARTYRNVPINLHDILFTTGMRECDQMAQDQYFLPPGWEECLKNTGDLGFPLAVEKMGWYYVATKDETSTHLASYKGRQ